MTNQSKRAEHGSKPLRSVLVIGAPLSLAVLEIFHPHPHDLFQLDLRAWLLVHYFQIVLFPLSALAVVVLVTGCAGVAAALCRVAMFVFATSFVAFDTAAGVVTGILLKAAKASGNPEVWQAPVHAIWEHPIMGGAPGTTPFLAVAGSVSWLVGGLMAAICIRRKGGSWLPVALLVVSAFSLSVFKTHAWPGGPISFGALALAAALVEIGG
jgi:hypothetical protein